MQLRNPNHYVVPVDFPRTGDDSIAHYMRWQECIFAGQHVANMCFDARADATPGSKDELLALAVWLVCGQNFTDEETRWVVRYSEAQLGW